MSRRKKSPHGRTSERKLRAEDSSDDLRRYQECAKKLDECSKNLLRLCQVSGELNNLNDDDIERAANEIIRSEEEEAKKIAAELVHQKGLLHRNIQEPEFSSVSHLKQEDRTLRPRSEGVTKSNASSSGRGTDYEVPKLLKNCQQEQDQKSNVHQQVINQPPYAIFHCEERVPCTPCSPQQYSSSGMARNPCTDYSSSSLKGPSGTSTPYNVSKVDGSDRQGPPYFRQAQQQPSQSTWGRPEPVWNIPVNRKKDLSGSSNPRLLEQCKEQMRKMNEMTQSSMAESTKRGGNPQTIHLTAGAGRTAADPPVHIVITAIANDCSSGRDNLCKQSQAYPREPVYSDNEFAEESGYSLDNKGPSTIYNSSPTGDDCIPQKYLGSQQKLVDRGSDAYVSPEDATPSGARPTYKEILDTILSQRPHDAESLLNSKGILNCALKCWENAKNSLRAKCPQQTDSCRDLQFQTIYERQEQNPSRTECSSLNLPPRNRSTECERVLQNLRPGYKQNCPEAPMKTFVCTQCGSSGRQNAVKRPCCDQIEKLKQRIGKNCGSGNQSLQRTALLKCCKVPTETTVKQGAGNRCYGVQSRQAARYPVDVRETLRQCSTPTTAPSPCNRETYYERQQFMENPKGIGGNQSQCGPNQQYQFGEKPPPRDTGKRYRANLQPCGTPSASQHPMTVPKTYRCTNICPPSSNASSLQCAPTGPVNRTQSKSMMKTTASEMDNSILLAIAKAAINLSLDKQREECEEEQEDEEDCDSWYPEESNTGCVE